MNNLNHPLVLALLPLVAFAALAPLLFRLLRSRWLEINAAVQNERELAAAPSSFDHRPVIAFSIAALCLTLQSYYGHRDTYVRFIRPWVVSGRATPPLFDDLYAQLWWVAIAFVSYVVVPLSAWKICFRHDDLLDLAGLRIQGLHRHGWLYVVCLAAVLPVLFIVARQPDFGLQYPFYDLASRSWLDFFMWEVLYAFQFFCLELFFRGWWLSTLRRSLGTGAIFSMVVPYCMIHFGKPYLETTGALVAGLVLGTLAMQSRSIYGGVLVHGIVAFTMDLLALRSRHALPSVGVPW